MKHNAMVLKKKSAKSTVGTNIRVSDLAYKAIRKYCQENSLYIGGFVERVVLEKISSEKSKK
jgi:hypothetical protein